MLCNFQELRTREGGEDLLADKSSRQAAQPQDRPDAAVKIGANLGRAEHCYYCLGFTRVGIFRIMSDLPGIRDTLVERTVNMWSGLSGSH